MTEGCVTVPTAACSERYPEGFAIEGWWRVLDGTLTLTDATCETLGERQLEPGEDARSTAKNLLGAYSLKAPKREFRGKLVFPKMGVACASSNPHGAEGTIRR